MLTPIGTGANGIPIEIFAAALAEDTIKELINNGSNLEEIIIVCNNKERADILASKFKSQRKEYYNKHSINY